MYGKIKQFAQLDQVRSVRLSTAGKYEKGAVSGAGVGSRSTVTCRTTEDLGIADLSGCRRSGRRSFSSISNDSDSIAECVSNKVKYQHDNTYHGVKTLARRLCSIRARSFTSPHIRAPLSLHCLCDSERAASMGCGQQTSTDRQQGCVLRCPGGASCCSAQPGLHGHWANLCGSATA